MNPAQFQSNLSCARSKQFPLYCLVFFAAWFGFARPAFAQPILHASFTPTITVNGPIGSLQQIQYSTNLQNSNAWTIHSNIRLGVSPKPFFDTSASGQPRAYRSVTVGLADTNFVWIPPGTFLMGSPSAEEGRSTSEGPQTLVTLTEGFFMSRHEAKNRDWLSFAGTLPSVSDSALTNYLARPVRQVSWSGATNYCAARTTLELAEGKIPAGAAYRLPTEAEWEYACRAGSTTVFSLGNELRSDIVRVDAAFDGNFPYPASIVSVNPINFGEPVAVATFGANGFGLYDLHGNAEEWCQDGFASSTPSFYPGGSVTNPVPNLSAVNKVLRGGGYASSGAQSRSAARRTRPNGSPSLGTGFRAVIPAFSQTNVPARLTPTVHITGPIGSMQQIQFSTDLSDSNGWTVLSHVRMDVSPKPFFDTAAAGPQRFYRTREIPVTDTNLVWIPSGTFLMGSPDTEEGRSTNEGPQTLVTLTQGFFMGRFEVTWRDWLVFPDDPQRLVDTDLGLPNYFDLPVRKLTWIEATNYCALRTASETAGGKIPAGWAYRLPTEAEWEYACRAGSTTVFPHGNQLRADGIRDDASFDGHFPYPTNIVPTGPLFQGFSTYVGSDAPNAFGLYDMIGNVQEWCLDGAAIGGDAPQSYPGGAVTNLMGGPGSVFKIVRGGSFLDTGTICRSAARRTARLAIQQGFRIVLAPATSLF